MLQTISMGLKSGDSDGHTSHQFISLLFMNCWVNTEKPTYTSTVLMHILAQKGTRASKSTVRKVIDGAGFTATVPRYDQMVRNVNNYFNMIYVRVRNCLRGG
jgi:hypothetical protein